MKAFWIANLLLLLSCQELSHQDCEELSMKKYKGIPHAANQFDSHCKKYEIFYSEAHCQKALVELIISQNPEKLKQKFGPKIMNCFTESDLNRFLKSK